MTISKARTVRLEINALGGERAMQMALEKAGDLGFSRRCPEWDEEDLPSIGDHASFHETAAAGYEVIVVRRGYSNSESSGEFDADYAIAQCSAALGLFANPDMVDGSGEYRAALDQAQLHQDTQNAGRETPRRRI